MGKRFGMSNDRDRARSDKPARDRRAGEPPADDDRDGRPGSSDAADATEDTAGPYGNPELDEESLRHRQQEGDPGRR